MYVKYYINNFLDLSYNTYSFIEMECTELFIFVKSATDYFTL